MCWVLFNTWEIVCEWQFYWSQTSGDCSLCELQSVSNILNSVREKKGLLHFFKSALIVARVLKDYTSQLARKLHFRGKGQHFFVVTLVLMFHMISAAESLSHMCTIIYSFIMRSRTSSHSMHAVPTLCIIHAGRFYSYHLCHINKMRRTNVVQQHLTCVYRSRCWWTSSIRDEHGFNIYVMVDLLMKYSKCSYRMIWHSYAFFFCKGQHLSDSSVCSFTCSMLMHSEGKRKLWFE